MGTPAAQCKGNLGRHFTVSGAAPRTSSATASMALHLRQYATVPFWKLLRISLRSGRRRLRRGAVYGRMLVLC